MFHHTHPYYSYMCITLLMMIRTELHGMRFLSVYITSYYIVYIYHIILYYRNSYFTTLILITHICASLYL